MIAVFQIPAMYDSNGVLSLLDRSRRPKQARWVPVLDTTTMPGRENRQESYWPVGATQQYLHAIILKGEERHPGFPTPLFQELDLKMPLLRLDVQQGELEEKSVESRSRDRDMVLMFAFAQVPPRECLLDSSTRRGTSR